MMRGKDRTVSKLALQDSLNRDDGQEISRSIYFKYTFFLLNLAKRFYRSFRSRT